jgi:hypothetical protein
MSVVNVKVKFLRKRGYSSLMEWLKDPNNVYIGRANRYVEGADESKWKNPFSVKKYGREECIKKYEEYLYSSGLIKDIDELRGKNLGCWCAPDGCHGDVLMKALATTE